MATDSGYTFYHIVNGNTLSAQDVGLLVTIVTNPNDTTNGSQTIIGSAPPPITPSDTANGYAGDNAIDTLTLNLSNGSVWPNAGYEGSGTAANGSTGLQISYWGNYFISKDSGLDGQTVVLNPGAQTVICFYPGTQIATPAGSRPVESLQIGEEVLTHDGVVAPVRWIGRQTVSTRFSDPLRVLPVRITAGALGSGLPLRDLLVSPDHALLIDDILVQAAALINGSSIRREAVVPETFTYYHVELADHTLILAEGVPAESFVDNVQRMGFDNWAEHEALYGNCPPIKEMPLPRIQSMRQLPMAIAARLAARHAA